MSQFTDDLFHLRGRVITARPNVTADFVRDCLNDRLRQILDHRTFWADLLKFGNLSFPDPYSVGAVTLSTGSNTVAGVADPDGNIPAWPVNDVVDTDIPDGVPEFGYAEVTPTSMAGITANSVLYVDASGEPEIVPVVEVGRTTFIGKFTKAHAASCTITQSSLANRQFRLSQSYPIFTVIAVKDSATLLLDLPWGGPGLVAQPYTIKVMYVILASDLKAIIAMKHETSGYPVNLHVSLDEANFRDPRRTLVSGNPRYSLVDLGANPQGNMLYEFWPAPGSAQQFSYCYQSQWPDMQKDTDRPPPFINPSILFYGALADAKMMRISKDDAYYDPAGAQYYEGKYRQGAQDATNADEAKCLQAMRSNWWKSMLPGNVDFYQLNDPGVAGFWSGGY